MMGDGCYAGKVHAGCMSCQTSGTGAVRDAEPVESSPDQADDSGSQAWPDLLVQIVHHFDSGWHTWMKLAKLESQHARSCPSQ